MFKEILPHQSKPVIHESRTYGCQSAERWMQPVAPKSIFCSAIQRLPISRASLISFCHFIQTSRSNNIWSGSPLLLCALFLDVMKEPRFQVFLQPCVFKIIVCSCVCENKKDPSLGECYAWTHDQRLLLTQLFIDAYLHKCIRLFQPFAIGFPCTLNVRNMVKVVAHLSCYMISHANLNVPWFLQILECR